MFACNALTLLRLEVMITKLLEIDAKLLKYKNFDKDVLKSRASFFKNVCVKFIEDDFHVKNEYQARESLVAECENKKIEDFFTCLGQTHEEYEKLLPQEVSHAWALLRLYLTNCVIQKEEQFVKKDNKYYVIEGVD